MKENSQWWISLYNALFLLTEECEVVAALVTDIFDPMDELEAALDNGINSASLDFFLSQNWITHNQKLELRRFYDLIDEIPSDRWDLRYLCSGSDWVLARQWARKLFHELGFESKGWNSSGTIIIYV